MKSNDVVTPRVNTPNYGLRLRIGMVLAEGNYCSEPDAHAILPNGVSLHTTRIALGGVDTKSLQGMLDEAEKAATLLVRTQPKLIVFHCTAASMLDPNSGDVVASRIKKATGISAITTSDAVVTALKSLKAKRIILLSPYEENVNGAEIIFFKHHGIEVIEERSFPPAPGGRYADATPKEWKDRTLSMRNSNADAYFLSCTNIRCVSVIEELEKELGRPVISSNSATIWHMLRMGEIKDVVEGYGELLRSF